MGNNYLRPYNTGVIQHDESIATIILYNKSAKNTGSNDSTSGAPKDYLADFSKKVNQIEFGDTGSSPDTDAKAIANISLNESGDLSPKNYYGVFNNFSLLNVAESREQIVKLHQNFGGSWNAFFLTERPRIYAFSGFFIDSKEYPYYQEFTVAYEKYLKGRKLIQSGFEMAISYDGKIIKGYLLDLKTQTTSAQQYMKTFSFSVLIQKESWCRTNFIHKDSEKPWIVEPEFNGMSNIARIDSMSRLEDNNGVIDGKTPTNGSR